MRRDQQVIVNRLSGVLALLSMLFVGCQRAPTDQAPQQLVKPTNPMAIETPPPEYPEELACAGVGGVVGVELSIGKDGRPTEVRVLESSRVAALDEAAIKAVGGWRFEPATVLGKPTVSRINVPVKFTPPRPLPDFCNKVNEERRRAQQQLQRNQ